MNTRCGWEKEDCWDQDIAEEEQSKICANISIIKIVIKLLVLADDLIARQAYWDAENLTAVNESNQDEYEYHLKMAKRYLLRGRREADKGRPHRAIRDFKISWKNSILAVKWVIQNYEDPNGTEDPGEKEIFPDFDIECFCCTQQDKWPWWLYWYLFNQWRFKKRFSDFPDWRDYTDPEWW